MSDQSGFLLQGCFIAYLNDIVIGSVPLAKTGYHLVNVDLLPIYVYCI